MNQLITFCGVYRNESNRIRYVLDLAKSLFPEMVIAVQDSQDNTREIVGEYTKNILLHPSQSPEESKDAIMKKVKTPWTFWLDADEYPSMDLINFLLDFDPKFWKFNVEAFKFPRINYINGLHIEANREADEQFRLIKSTVRWNPAKQGQRIHIHPIIGSWELEELPIYHHRTLEKIEKMTDRWNELDPKTKDLCNEYRNKVREKVKLLSKY